MLDPVQPGSASQVCETPTNAGAVEFFVPPGSTFTITETETTAAVGPTRIECDVFNPSQETSRTVEGDLGTRSITVELAAGETSPYCLFVNDSVPICVVKALGSGASTVAFATDFGLQLDEGEPETPGPACDQFNPSVQFYVAPGEDFTISEVLPDNSPVRPTLIECRQDDIPDVGRVFIGTADLTDGSIAVTADEVELGIPVECTFVNDAIVVCITKVLGDDANAIADPSDFTFDLLVSGEDPLELTPGSFDPACGEQEPQDNVGYAGAVLPPGTVFSLGERDPGPNVGLSSASCIAGSTEYELDETTLASRTIEGITSDISSNLIDCQFRNDAVLVCVSKLFGPTATNAGLTTAGTFDATADGAVVADDVTPVGALDDSPCVSNAPINSLVSFYAAPGSAITITENVPDGSPLGLTTAECAWQAEGPIPLETTLVNQSVSFELIERGRVDCELTNDIAVVCVVKSVGRFATELGIAAGDFDFSLTVDGQAMPEATDACPEPSTATARTTGFAIPQGATFTLTEAESTSLAGLLFGECSWNSSSVQADLTTRSVIVDSGGATNVDCRFLNDVVELCVSKELGPNAEALGITTSEFTFSVLSDGETIEATPGACGGSEPGEGSGTPFYIRPRSGFTLSEMAAASTLPTAAVAASCADEVGTVGTTDLAAGSVTVAAGQGATSLQCSFTNETAVVCVTKSLTSEGQAALGAGEFALADFSFGLVVDGSEAVAAVAAGSTTPQLCEASADPGSAVVELLAAPGSEYTVTETIADGVPSGPLVSICEDMIATRSASVTFAPLDLDESPNRFECSFLNHSVEVNLIKSLITDDGIGAEVGDFTFDAFDGAGASIATGLVSGQAFYVAPETTFSVSEAADGRFTSSVTCLQNDEFTQALDGATVAVFTPTSEATTVDCTFVNDDIPPIPVCAMLIFEEGDSDFTLADFTFELFADGALVGQRTADGGFDLECEPTSVDTAELLPGNLVLLGEVFADGSSYTMAVSVEDPDEVIEIESSACTVDEALATQAIDATDTVTFAVDPGSDRAVCVVRAEVIPPTPETAQTVVRPPFEPEPTAAPVVAVAVEQPQVVPAIAVTGTSTTAVTMPLGLLLVSLGFAGLGVGRQRRQTINS